MPSNLTAKKGKIPVWAWIGGGLVLAYVAYRFYTGQSGSSGNAQQTQSTAASTPGTATGLVPSAGSPGDTGQTTSDLVSALGAQQSTLLQSIEAANQDVLGLAESQIAAAQGNPQISPSSTSETLPAVGSQPGGANAPQYVFLSPQVLAPTSSSPPASAPSVSQHPASTGGFGGVASVRTLSSGARLTTYASGRQVEQVPGKSAYVVRA